MPIAKGTLKALTIHVEGQDIRLEFEENRLAAMVVNDTPLSIEQPVDPTPPPPVVVTPEPTPITPPTPVVVTPPQPDVPPTPVIVPPAVRPSFSKPHRIGTNLMELRDYCGYFPFTDMLTLSRSWISGVLYGTWDDGRPLDLNSISGNQVARKVLFSRGAYRPGRLVLSWHGTATITLNGGTVLDRAPGMIEFEGRDETIWIDVHDGSISDLMLVTKEDFDRDDLLPVFNPDFISEIAQYDVVRFMDLQQTNVLRSTEQMMGDMTPILGASLIRTSTGDGVPTNCLVQMANEARVDGYFCLPINATDEYVREFCDELQFMRGVSYIELSNEIWNPLFPQARYFSSDWNENMAAASRRAGQVFRIVKEILGDRAKCVLAGQSANIWWIERALNIIKDAGLRAPDCISTAPYFGHSLSDVADVAALNDAVAEAVAQAANAYELAQKYKLEYVAYECGQHITQNGGQNVNTTPELAATLGDYMRQLQKATGGSLLIHFSLFGPWSKDGSWTLKQNQYDADADSNKYVAMERLLK